MRNSNIVVLGVVATALAGCVLATGGIGGSAGSGGTGGGGGPSSSSTASSTSTSSSSGAMACKPGDTAPCYTGATGTEGQGACHGGTKTCKPDGSAFDACMGEQTPLPNNCASGLNLHCDAMTPTCTGALGMGGKAWGGTGDDRGYGIAIDSTGSVVVGGLFDGTVDFGNGKMKTTKDSGADAFVAKYDTMGNLSWVVQAGDTGDDAITAVTVGEFDNVYIAGSYDNQVTIQTVPPTVLANGPGLFVAKLDKAGNGVWAMSATGSGSHTPQGIAVNGNVIAVAGFTTGNLTVGSTMVNAQNTSDYDGFVFTLDTMTGNVGWVKHLKSGAGNESQILNGVAVDTDGSVIVTGSGQGPVDFNDGTAAPPHKNGTNVIAARYAPDGKSTLWKMLVGDDNNTQYGLDVALGPTGEVYLTGAFQQHLGFPGMLNIGVPAMTPMGTNAIFVAKLDKMGNGLWGQAFTPSNTGDSAGIGIAADGYGVVVGGYFTDTLNTPTPLISKGGKDALVMKLAADKGTPLWARQLGDAMDDKIYDVALDPRKLDPLGQSAVTGSYVTTIDVGSGFVPGKGSNDMFFARLTP